MGAHYADAFTIIPGRCFRMVHDPDPRHRGQPIFCREPVVWRGRLYTAGKNVYRVDSCETHSDELINCTPIQK
jgi:hypothetical protein